MTEKSKNVLKYIHGEKCMKVPFVIYADTKSLIEKTNTCYNDLENSSTAKVKKNTASDYSFFTHCSFYVKKNKRNYYKDKDCMKTVCKDLTEYVMNITNFERLKMSPLTEK